MGARFIPARVSGIHRDEDPETGLDDDVAAHERNTRVIALERLLDGHHLLAHDGQHLLGREHSTATQRFFEFHAVVDDGRYAEPVLPLMGEMTLLCSQHAGKSRVPRC